MWSSYDRAHDTFTVRPANGADQLASRDYADGRFAEALLPADLSGFGFSNGTGYWARVVPKASGETITSIETAPLAFTPT